jgi:DNA-binding transcriptional LysR family regulator
MSMRQTLVDSQQIVRPSAGSRSAPSEDALFGTRGAHPRRAGVHPLVVAAAAAGAGVFVLAVWIAFNLNRETIQNLVVVTALVAGFLLLFGGLAWRAANDPRWAEPSGDLTSFLDAEVDIATGPAKGRDVLWTVLILPFALALGMLAIGIVLRLTI